MKNHFLLIIPILLIQLSLNAQTAISGIVTDSFNKPIPYATVCLSRTSIGTITDMDGKYLLKVKQMGSYQLFVSCIGYASYVKNVQVDSLSLNINIRLSTHDFKLSEVVIKSSKRFQKQYFSIFINQFIGETPNLLTAKS